MLTVTVPPARAVTYTVTNTSDSGSGSLRAAISDANATADNDVIVFDIPGCPNGVCTIVLTSGQFTVSGNNSAGTLTISHSAGPQNLIISGNHVSRIFYVDSGAHLSVDGLTMERGTAEAGGGILSRGDLRITNAAIQDCVSINYWAGGGIANYGGNLVLELTEVRNNTATWGGGGIFSIDGPLSIRDSTIAGNVGYGGGGIDLSAYANYSWSATIVNSTLSGNVSRHPDGDLQAGGAVYLENSQVPVLFINVTVTMNSAVTGGAVFADGLIGGSMYFRNSIFSGNKGSQYPDLDTRYGSYHDLGNNLIGVAPLLGALANNGGLTRTHALLAGSPAINAGNNCVLTKNGCGDGNPALSTDQRGFDRVGTVDIGAFELGAPGNSRPRRIRADFDGDGKTDLSVFRPSDGNWYALKSGGGVLVTSWGAATDTTVPGDYDHDGKADMAVYRPSSGQWFILRSSDFTVNVVGWGAGGDVPTAGDFDGDGKADEAVYRPSAGQWFVFRSSDNGASIINWGNATDVPVQSDYDGDGKTDVAVFRPSTGQWFLFRSTDGPLVAGWGIAGDKPIEADYDGDNKDDIAVYRPSDGNWYIFRSSDSSASIINWGNATDIPVPGDYDGDGKDDEAIYRDGTWFVLQSTAGVLVASWGAAGDIPIPARYIP